MLQPKRVKFRKSHKGHRRGKAQAGNTMIFGDFGLIGHNFKDLRNKHFHQAYGIGLRFRNESFSMNTSQIALTYTPADRISGKSSFGILLTSNFFGLDNLSISQPGVIKFEN